MIQKFFSTLEMEITLTQEWLEKNVLVPFVRYTSVETTSDRHGTTFPSTAIQWDLLRMLKTELEAFPHDSVTLNDDGYLIARIPGRGAGVKAPIIALLAHVDTSSDVQGKTKPQVHRNYSGGSIVLTEDVVINPADSPELNRYIGNTIITTDGTSLLGADDKAGITEILAALVYFQEHPELDHPPLEIIFTPDEETGHGMDRFPIAECKAYAGYTMDGGTEGILESQCFNAWKADVTFTGSVIHLGSARGKLANAVSMAGAYIAMLPRSESPEATDRDFGFYCPLEVKGDLQTAVLEVFLRDFEVASIKRRISGLEAFAKAVEAQFPGGKVTVKAEKQYLNMNEYFNERPLILETLTQAVKDSGIEPRFESIRGGTDGARLSEMGVPTPNVFTGAQNLHSKKEWICLEAMGRAVSVLVRLLQLWADKRI